MDFRNDGWIERQEDRKIGIQTYTKVDRKIGTTQMDEWMDGLMDSLIDGTLDRYIDRQVN